MVLQASATSHNAEDCFYFCMLRFVLEMFAGLKMFHDIAKELGARGQICPRKEASSYTVLCETNCGLPFSRQVIGAVVAQLFWLCMKAVLSFIAKDVVAKGLDHDTFVLSIRSSQLESFLKGML
ncbi:hypothetical protein YC2023_015463 [Brassica napus]